MPCAVNRKHRIYRVYICGRNYSLILLEMSKSCLLATTAQSQPFSTSWRRTPTFDGMHERCGCGMTMTATKLNYTDTQAGYSLLGVLCVHTLIK